MRRVAKSDRSRAWPPRDAMRFFSGADNLALRAFPPFLPRVLAISEAFIVTHCTWR
jgi:hypothetical protein